MKILNFQMLSIHIKASFESRSFPATSKKQTKSSDFYCPSLHWTHHANKFFKFSPLCQQIFKKFGMIKHPAWKSFGRKNGNKKCTYFLFLDNEKSILYYITHCRYTFRMKKYHLFNLKALQSSAQCLCTQQFLVSMSK